MAGYLAMTNMFYIGTSVILLFPLANQKPWANLSIVKLPSNPILRYRREVECHSN